MEFLAAQSPDVLNAHIKIFMKYTNDPFRVRSEPSSIGSAHTLLSMPDDEVKPQPVKLVIKPYSGKKKENLELSIYELVIAHWTGTIQFEYQVAVEFNKLFCLEREWAVTCTACIDDAFPTRKALGYRFPHFCAA